MGGGGGGGWGVAWEGGREGGTVRAWESEKVGSGELSGGGGVGLAEVNTGEGGCDGWGCAIVRLCARG